MELKNSTKKGNCTSVFVFQNNLTKFLVTCLELGTNYKIALHEQVNAIGQEKGANMETRETMFLYMSENENRTWNFFIGYFFQSVRPGAVTTSLKV